MGHPAEEGPVVAAPDALNGVPGRAGGVGAGGAGAGAAGSGLGRSRRGGGRPAGRGGRGGTEGEGGGRVSHQSEAGGMTQMAALCSFLARDSGTAGERTESLPPRALTARDDAPRATNAGEPRMCPGRIRRAGLSRGSRMREDAAQGHPRGLEKCKRSGDGDPPRGSRARRRPRTLRATHRRASGQVGRSIPPPAFRRPASTSGQLNEAGTAGSERARESLPAPRYRPASAAMPARLTARDRRPGRRPLLARDRPLSSPPGSEYSESWLCRRDRALASRPDAKASPSASETISAADMCRLRRAPLRGNGPSPSSPPDPSSKTTLTPLPRAPDLSAPAAFITLLTFSTLAFCPHLGRCGPTPERSLTPLVARDRDERSGSCGPRGAGGPGSGPADGRGRGGGAYRERRGAGAARVGAARAAARRRAPPRGGAPPTPRHSP